MSQGAGYYSQWTGAQPGLKKWKYDGWAKGQNSYSHDNETRDDEWVRGVNVELVNRSTIRMGRRGHRSFAEILGAENFNGWGVYKNPKTGSNYMLAQVDGRLYKISTAGVVQEIDNTKTWDTSAKMRGVLLREWFYFGNGVDYMAKTDGSSIVRWNSVTAPTGVSLTKAGTGSEWLYEYAVAVVTDVGETEISTVVQDFHAATLDNTNYFTVTWNRKTDANVRGYNIYKAIKGSTITMLTFVDQQSSGATMSFADKGVLQRSLLFEAPSYNTTGGVKGNLFAKYYNTLFIAGNLEEPDTVFYGGTGDNWESFSPSDNGGWVKPGRGDGERVTQMIGFEDFLFIFKENSVWKFIFASDGGPQLTAVIPQYGTSSPDTVWRMEKDIVFMGSDGRYRVMGYEPNQLNVIRTTDISNRIQPDLDAMNKTNLDNLSGFFFEQKFAVCDRNVAYPYDRRYLGFLGQWTNYHFERFLVWDQGTGAPRLFGAEQGTGKIKQLLVDNTWDDDGTSIACSFRPKTVDGGEDTMIKTYFDLTYKVRSPIGLLTFNIYSNNELIESDPHVFGQADQGFESYMWDEPMWDEGLTQTIVTQSVELVKKDLETLEEYSIYPEIIVNANVYNHVFVQTISGKFELEDSDHERDEVLL